MKTILILVVSFDEPPYDKMITTSQNTWDSIDVEGCNTIFYCGATDNKHKVNVVYLPVSEGLFNMGRKLLLAFQYVLSNYKFDYMARVNSSTYVDKKELIKYVQTLPETIFAGLEVKRPESFDYIWGFSYIISRDIVQRVVGHQERWEHQFIEDESLSKVVASLGFAFSPGKAVSIDQRGLSTWAAIIYGGGESFEFTDFADIKKIDNQFFYRVKQDYNRAMDAYIMKQLYENLK